MRPVHCVLPVHVSHAQKSRVVLLPHQLNLMHASVRTQAYLIRLVVCVGSAPADVVLGDAEVIKAVLDVDEGVEVGEHLELLPWKLQVRDLGLREKVVDLADQGAQGVTRLLINLTLCQIQYLIGNVVIRVFRHGD